TAARPKEITKWIGVGRSKDPDVNMATFPADVWQWWTHINPAWRKEGGTLVQKGSGPWDELNKPGVNGLLNVLACLRWWDAGIKTAEQREEWERVVMDVHWAL
ncbi:hypothetical protein FB45DRAFT_720030, partial [Roridomyces roridus]